MSIGDNIYYNRSRVGMSKEELAEKLNVSTQLVSNWEMREKKPDIEKILQMCGLLSCTLDELLQGETEIEEVSEDFIKKYERHMNAFAREFSIATGFLFFGVATLLILLSLDYSKTTAVFWMVATIVVGIAFGMKSLFSLDAFSGKYPFLPNFYSKKQTEKAQIRVGFLFFAAIGLVGWIVVLIFKSSIFPELNEMGTLFTVGVFLIVSGLFVMTIIDLSIRASSYDIERYNKDHIKTVLKKKGISTDGYR